MIYTKCLSCHLSFYATQIISPFINSKISTNHDKVDGLSANGEKGIVFLLQYLFYLDMIRINCRYKNVEGETHRNNASIG